MDADNLARPDMVERLVTALEHCPEVSVATCFYLAFRHSGDPERGRHPYAYRPLGGPVVLGALQNVFGDANSLFRTEAFRSVGGFETDRDTSWEDYEALAKLALAGHQIDTVPDYLFYYRHLETGFSRTTDHYRNQQRVLRQFYKAGALSPAEGIALWSALHSMARRNDFLHLVLRSLRYRVADHVHALVSASPAVKRSVRWLLKSGRRALKFLGARG